MAYSRIIISKWLFLTLFAVLFLAKDVITADSFVLSRDLLHQAERKFGKAARSRLAGWEDVIRTAGSGTDRQKLEKANSFFNSRMRFVNDYDLWGAQDYWATPVEFLSRGAGDCEDFAIAKYFTLKAMGIADEKLRITYVKAIQQNIHHMVLTYYSEPDAEPLVLDNLVDSISPASRRTDLMPIFSFNGTGLWTAKLRGQGRLAGSSNRIRLWQDLLHKMATTTL
jgi:predicted transglutaminase-like cysteine proteinase